MNKNDSFGDRMKLYEGLEAQRKFMPCLPVVARLDGRGFSRFTKGLDRPYDQRMIDCMVETTKYLVDHTNAVTGYTQSDEITLVWHPDKDIWFDGRISKLTSQLAAQATVFFYREVIRNLPPEYGDKLPTFDARVWTVPSKQEAVNAVLWREQDATKNSITMAASTVYSHKELLHKNSSDKRQMLLERGINWNDYPSSFKRGVYVQRKEVRKLTPNEIRNLPPLHHAHSNPNIEVIRSVVDVVEMPPLATVINRVDVIFDQHSPLIQE